MFVYLQCIQTKVYLLVSVAFYRTETDADKYDNGIVVDGFVYRLYGHGGSDTLDKISVFLKLFIDNVHYTFKCNRILAIYTPRFVY